MKKGVLIPILIVLFLLSVVIAWIAIANNQSSTIKRAREHNDLEHYSRYITEFPEGKYISECKEWLIDYYDISVMNSEKKKWAESIKTLKNAKDYYYGYGSSLISNAIDSLIEAKVQREYSKTALMDTKEGWLEYRKYMPSTYWKDSDQRIKEIEERRWNNEAGAWNAASEVDKVDAYNKYLSLYPTGKHANQARKRLIDIEVDKIFAKEHGNLPSMNKSYYSGGNSSSISVTNDTQYQLTLLYSGTTSTKIQFSPGQTKRFTLPNGIYRIAASVAAAGIIPYAGVETLDGGGYSISYYITTNYKNSYNSLPYSLF